MTDTANEKPTREEVTDQAAMWLVRLDAGTADEQEFEAWRAADPAHAAAFARMAAVDEAVDDAYRDIRPVRKSETSVRTVSRRNLLRVAVAFGAVSAVGIGGWAAIGLRASAQTRVGQRKRVVLPGGAMMELNTDSRASWRQSGQGLQVWLERGEIGLSVDSPVTSVRLFAGGQNVQIQRGDFNARLRDGALELVVVGGECRLETTSAVAGGARGFPVSAGQGILTAGTSIEPRALSSSEIEFATGWRNGELILNGQTLGAVVEEYNRYLDHKIVVADPDLMSLRLGGRFTSTDPADFLKALQSSFGVKVQTSSTGAVLISK